jgi:hypothetical protein
MTVARFMGSRTLLVRDQTTRISSIVGVIFILLVV